MMDFFEAVERRRSVRRFTGKAVPAEMMERAFQAAQKAPNSSNLQTTEFYWIKSPEKKEKMVKACLDQGAARTAQELLAVVSRTDLWKRNNRALLEQIESLNSPAIEQQRKYYGKLIPFVYGYRWLAPVKWLIFNLVGLRRPMMRGPVSRLGLNEVSIKSSALAAENFMLSIAAQGFDSCPMEGFDESRVKKILDLPWSARVVMCIGVGERDPKGIWGMQYRFPLDWFRKQV